MAGPGFARTRKHGESVIADWRSASSPVWPIRSRTPCSGSHRIVLKALSRSRSQSRSRPGQTISLSRPASPGITMGSRPSNWFTSKSTAARGSSQGRLQPPEKKVQLRLVVNDTKYTAQFRPDAKGESTTCKRATCRRRATIRSASSATMAQPTRHIGFDLRISASCGCRDRLGHPLLSRPRLEFGLRLRYGILPAVCQTPRSAWSSSPWLR